MSTTKIIKGWVNPDQARRSSDGYDGGIVRLNVYGPDEPNAGCDIYDYDEPATLYIGTGKMWTEEEVRAHGDDLLLAHMSPGQIVERADDYEEPLYRWIDRAIKAVNAKHGLTL